MKRKRRIFYFLRVQRKQALSQQALVSRSPRVTTIRGEREYAVTRGRGGFGDVRDFPRNISQTPRRSTKNPEAFVASRTRKSSRLLVEKSSSLTTNIASKAFTRGRCLRIRMCTHVWVYNTRNKIWFIHVSVHAHAYSRTRARLFVRVSAYNALYPRYRSYDRTIKQEMEEIYRLPESEKKNNESCKNRGKIA